MQDRYTMFRRGAVLYYEDRTTGQQKSLRTRDESEARRILQAKNDAVNQPLMNLVMAKTYLAAQDPKLVVRTWADVMQMFCERGKASTRIRHERVVRSKPMQYLHARRPPPRRSLPQTLPPAENRRRNAAQLPLRMGRAGEGGRHPAALGTGSLGAQFQGGTRRLGATTLGGRAMQEQFERFRGEFDNMKSASTFSEQRV